MKKTYQNPEMTVMKLQHQSIICLSEIRGINSDDVDYGGASTNNAGGVIRTKESGGIWDDEW